MAAAGDISWQSPRGTFNLRVAAILTSGSDILLCTFEGLDYWYLPGGRVHLGESTEAALARELTEELGHEFPAGTLALVVENIYRSSQGLGHEIGFYYRLTWPAVLSRDDLSGAEPGHVFRWAPATGLGSLRFEPAGLASALHNLDGTLRHLVLDGEDG
jgi:ADP-ribose pyrophosphatase YjhB (NUDIX family)